MRTTRGKPTLARSTYGEPELAEALADALAHEAREDRTTHGFHTYPAGLHPDAARDLLRLFDAPRVLDPFCGAGSVLVEAAVAGRQATGGDVGPIARLVALARTAATDEDTRTAYRSAARRLTEGALHADRPPPPALLARVEQWYAPHVLVELESLRAGIVDADVPPLVRRLLWATLSSILIKVSWQRSDTSPQRVVHDRPPGTAAVLFHKKARELGRRLAALEEAVPPGTPQPVVLPHDARDPWRREVQVDLVVTSPPYPAVYDYLPMQALREAWLDVPSQPADEIAPRRAWNRDPRAAFAQWREDTDRWVACAAATLAPGGHLVVVVGDGLVADGPVRAEPVTTAAAERAGLIPRAGATLARPDHARRATRDEHVLVYAKSAVPRP